MKKEKIITISLIAFWVLLFFAALEWRARMAFVGLPIVGLIFVGYMVYLTLKGCKPSSLTNGDDNEKETN